jgi:hypothetical protein
MALTNNFKDIIDLPVSRQIFAQLPVASTALTALTSVDDGSSRYMYCLQGNSFYRVDTKHEQIQQLQSIPVITATTVTSLKYSKYNGYRGNCLGASTNTINVSGLKAKQLQGLTIRIVDGLGAGQERTITDVTDATILDVGNVTAVGAAIYTGTAPTITDSTKKWKINMWTGFQCRIVHNTGISQTRKILYNDETTLFFHDLNYQQLEPWNNNPLYVLPVTTAGSQAQFFIEQSVITVNTAWSVVPDWSSSYVIMGGGIWAITSTGVAPFCYFLYYDIISDSWSFKTTLGSIINGTLSSDYQLERMGEIGGSFLNGSISSADSLSVTVGEALGVNKYVNFQIRVTDSNGLVQKRRIRANTANKFIVEIPFSSTPTGTYSIYGDTESLFLNGTVQSVLRKYDVEKDIWANGNYSYVGTARNIYAQFAGQEAFGVTSITRATGGITAVNPVPTAKGTGYRIGDVLTVSTGGTGGAVYVETISGAGVVETVSLRACGSTYTTGTGKATTGGTGSGCTVEITTIGVVGLLTTVANHNFVIGDQNTVGGCTDSNWNVTSTILGVPSKTTIEFATTAAANAVAANSQSTTVVVDARANYAVNELQGKCLQLMIAGIGGAVQSSRKIVSNTATTITLSSAISAATNGTTRYFVYDMSALGRDKQFLVNGQDGFGQCTGGSSTTTLVDTTKSWIPNCWAGYKFRILAGTGYTAGEITITSNTATTLTFATQSFTPDTTTRYSIMDMWGLATAATNAVNATITDTTKNWKVNQLAGKKIFLTSGSGVGQELLITSNTATVITCTGTFPLAPSTDTCYCITSAYNKTGNGSCLLWNYGASDLAIKGGKFYSFRGAGTAVLDVYDISTEIFDFCYSTSFSELLNAGAAFAYDGEDSIYIQQQTALNAPARIFRLCLKKHFIVPSINFLMIHNTASMVGSRFEIIKTTDGVKYAYMVQNGGTAIQRCYLPDVSGDSL